MTYSPVPVETFGGLNLTDDPGTVGWGGAIDLLNVDFDKRGRVRSRYGYSKFNSVAGTDYFLDLIPWDANGQILCGDAGGQTRAYDTTGTLVASQATFAIKTGASLGTGTAGPYFYYSDGTNAAKRWDGAAFSSPAGMPIAKYLAVQPVDNRLVAAYTGSTTKSRVQFSDAGAPETWTATNYVDLHPNDGQEIRAMVTWRELIFVFKETKFFIFYGNSTDASGNPIFNYRTVDTGIGIGRSSSYAAVAAEDAVYFVNSAGIWRTTGGAPELLPGLEALFTTGSPFFQSSGVCLFANRPVAIGHRIYFPVGITPNAYADSDPLILVWDTVTNQWSAWQFGAFAVTKYLAALRLSSSDVLPTLLFSYPTTAATKSIGKVVSSATDDDGTSLTSRYRSGFSDLGSTDQKDVREWILEGSGSPTLKTSYEFGSLETGAAVTLGTAPAIDQGRRRYAVRGRQFSWQVGGTSSWSLNNFAAHVRDKRTPGAHS